MTAAYRTIVASVFLLLIQSQPCLASDPNTIVWLADDTSIKGLEQIDFYPVSHDIRNSYVHQVSPVVSRVIRSELANAGITVSNINKNTLPVFFALETHIVHCQPGNVGGRWVGFGGGAAICILRTRIISGLTGKVVGEIIVANEVSSGGLFSAGAESYVPEGAARQTAEELVDLFGLEQDSDTGKAE